MKNQSIYLQKGMLSTWHLNLLIKWPCLWNNSVYEITLSMKWPCLWNNLVDEMIVDEMTVDEMTLSMKWLSTKWLSMKWLSMKWPEPKSKVCNCADVLSVICYRYLFPFLVFFRRWSVICYSYICGFFQIFLFPVFSKIFLVIQITAVVQIISD